MSSNTQEYRYVIDVNPDDLNRLEEYDKKIQEMKEESSSESKGEISREDMDTILAAIGNMSGGSSSFTYTYDDEKIDKILALASENKNLTLMIYAHLKGIDLPDKFGDIVDQMEDLSKLDLFKITEDLAELDSAIRGGGFEGRILRDDIVDQGGSTVGFALSNQVVNEIAKLTAQTEVRDRIDIAQSAQQTMEGGLFSEKSVSKFKDTLGKIDDLKTDIDRYKITLEKMEDTRESTLNMLTKLGTEGDVGSLDLLDDVSKRIADMRTKLTQAEDDLAGVLGGRGFAAQMRVMREKGVEGLGSVLTSAGLSVDQAEPLLTAFDSFVRTLKDKPEVFADMENPQQEILDQFINSLIGKETTFDILRDNKDAIQQMISSTVRENIENYLQAQATGDPVAQAGALAKFQYATPAITAAEQLGGSQGATRAFGEQIKGVQSMMGELNVAVKAAVSKVNREIEAATDSQDEDREDIATDLSEVLTKIDDIKTGIEEKLNQLAEVIEDRAQKDSDDTVRTTL